MLHAYTKAEREREKERDLSTLQSESGFKIANKKRRTGKDQKAENHRTKRRSVANTD